MSILAAVILGTTLTIIVTIVLITGTRKVMDSRPQGGKPMSSKLYHIDDIVASCNACGAHTLTRNPKDIKHYPSCKGITEVKKWDKYYSDPEWAEAFQESRWKPQLF